MEAAGKKNCANLAVLLDTLLNLLHQQVMCICMISICLSVCLSIINNLHLSIYLTIYLSIHLSITVDKLYCKSSMHAPLINPHPLINPAHSFYRTSLNRNVHMLYIHVQDTGIL